MTKGITMSKSNWLFILAIVASPILVGCSGSKQVATRESEESSPDTSSRPKRNADPGQQSSSGQNANQANSGSQGARPQNTMQQKMQSGEFENRSSSNPNQNSNVNNQNSVPDSTVNRSNPNQRNPSNNTGGNRPNVPNSAGSKNPNLPNGGTNGGRRPGNAPSSAGAKKKKPLTKAAPTGKKGTNPGDTLPEIKGKDMDGQQFKLSDYRGKVIMVDFWGDW